MRALTGEPATTTAATTTVAGTRAETRADTLADVRADTHASPVHASPAQTRHDVVTTAAASTTPAAPAMPTRAEVGRPIPYRAESEGVASSAGGAIFAALLLLGLFTAVLVVARRKGLLDRWIVAPPAGRPERSGLRVEQALRVSPKTMLYRVRDGERSYLLVESLAQATLHPVTDGTADGFADASPHSLSEDDPYFDDADPDDSHETGDGRAR